MDDALLTSVEAAVAALPHDLILRVRLADLLAGAGRSCEAVLHAATALSMDPLSPPARAAMARALAADPLAASAPAA